MRADLSPHQRGGDGWVRLTLLPAATLLVVLGACGRPQARDTTLSFEDLTDTTGLARGPSILTSFEPHRLVGGAMRVRGSANLPDGTRLQISVVRVATQETVALVQVTVQEKVFETAPLMGPRGPLPPDLYRFDVLAHFNPAWQPEHVLRVTHDGHSLRGPGVLRGAGGQPALFLREEHRL